MNIDGKCLAMIVDAHMHIWRRLHGKIGNKTPLVGLGNGLACGLVGALVVFLVKGDGWLGAILAMAMVINMFVAATAGTLIPLALRALKVDPALASSVFITTLTDVFGFLSFLGLGTLFIKYLHVAG